MERDLSRLLATLDPQRDSEPWVFASVMTVPASLSPLMTFRETEGTTCIVTLADAATAGFAQSPVWARITLGVASSLEAVGLTAAIATALTSKGISANVVAAFHHDHVFVPLHQADLALTTLQALASPL